LALHVLWADAVLVCGLCAGFHRVRSSNSPGALSHCRSTCGFWSKPGNALSTPHDTRPIGNRGTMSYCRAGRSDVPPEKVRGLVPVRQSFGAGVGAAVSTGFIEVSAPFATPTLNGKPLVTPFEFPKTSLCFLLHAQVVQSAHPLLRHVRAAAAAK